LKLIPTHPDKHGGLGFLSVTPPAFAPITFAASAVINLTLRHPSSWCPPEGFHATHHCLCSDRRFCRPWAVGLFCSASGASDNCIAPNSTKNGFFHRTGHEAEFLQAPESSTLADYGQSYEKIEELNPFPADKQDLIPLALAIAIPAFPVIIAQIPVAIVLQDLLRALR
jgi:hypothetical protein